MIRQVSSRRELGPQRGTGWGIQALLGHFRGWKGAKSRCCGPESGRGRRHAGDQSRSRSRNCGGNSRERGRRTILETSSSFLGLTGIKSL
jgi:hypothetical protein